MGADRGAGDTQTCVSTKEPRPGVPAALLEVPLGQGPTLGGVFRASLTWEVHQETEAQGAGGDGRGQGPGWTAWLGVAHEGDAPWW